MVQFDVLSGNMAGARTVARRFPFHVGRAAGNDLRLDDGGVWDRHFRLDFRPGEGFVLTPEGEALITVNDQPSAQTVLRNGDRLGLGSARLQFWLAETSQRGLTAREVFAWACIGAVTLAQIALIYLLQL